MSAWSAPLRTLNTLQVKIETIVLALVSPLKSWPYAPHSHFQSLEERLYVSGWFFFLCAAKKKKNDSPVKGIMEHSGVDIFYVFFFGSNRPKGGTVSRGSVATFWQKFQKKCRHFPFFFQKLN